LLSHYARYDHLNPTGSKAYFPGKRHSTIEGMAMTIEEFIQSIVLVFCLMATSVVLPVYLVLGSEAEGGKITATAEPVFVFEQNR
jgi:hypothetical protein